MHQLQEMICLHRMGQSLAEIARQLRMGPDTIRHYLDVFAEGGLQGGVDDLPAAGPL